MISKYVPAVFIATMLGILAVSGADPEDAGAAITDEVSTADVRGCTGGDVSLSVDEKRMLDLHTNSRAEHELPKFCVHPALQRAARTHSKEMVDRGTTLNTTRPAARGSGTASRASVTTGGPLVRIFSMIQAPRTLRAASSRSG